MDISPPTDNIICDNLLLHAIADAAVVAHTRVRGFPCCPADTATADHEDYIDEQSPKTFPEGLRDGPSPSAGTPSQKADTGSDSPAADMMAATGSDDPVANTMGDMSRDTVSCDSDHGPTWIERCGGSPASALSEGSEQTPNTSVIGEAPDAIPHDGVWQPPPPKYVDQPKANFNKMRRTTYFDISEYEAAAAYDELSGDTAIEKEYDCLDTVLGSIPPPMPTIGSTTWCSSYSTCLTSRKACATRTRRRTSTHNSKINNEGVILEQKEEEKATHEDQSCLLYTSPSPRDS